MRFVSCISILIALLIGFESNAQQLNHSSQFIINKAIYSPSLIGVENDLEVVLNYRNQWAGMENAPTTLLLSLAKDFSEKKYAIGGVLLSESLGVTKRHYMSISYAYDVKLADDYLLSFGLASSMTNYITDASMLVLTEYNDNVISNQVSMRSFSPDFNFGLTIKHKDFYAGMGINNLVESKLNLFSDNVDYQLLPMDLSRHIFIYGVYRYNMEKFNLTPFGLVKRASNAPSQVELGGKVRHIDSGFWTGITYRHQDAFSIALGYEMLQQFEMAYAYDFTISKLRQVSSGSHEITLRYFIDKKSTREGAAKFN